MDDIMKTQEQNRPVSVSRTGSMFNTELVSRRTVVKTMGAAFLLTMIGCSPVKFIVGAYSKRYEDDRVLADAFLTAFVEAVVPGVDTSDKDFTRMFRDDYYPFVKFRAFFLNDLASRTTDRFHHDRFHKLTIAERTMIIQDGLKADATVQRLYRGAILMAQVSAYTSPYNDERGCALIDFHGSNTGFTPEEMFYASPQTFMAKEITQTGNPW